jgi:predicted GIY-YIG superfamily endonuclease
LRCVYVYEFRDKYAYIGLTLNIENRDKNHRKIKSPVGRHILQTNQEPKLIKLTDYIDVNEAIKIEIDTIKKYHKNKWKLLNNTPGGETGCSVLFWDKKACLSAAKKCKTKNEFVKKFHGAWSSAKNHNWLSEIQKIFPETIKPKGYWTKERCKNEALKYDMKEKLRKGCPSAYTMSIKNKWFKEITEHMK